MDRIIGDCTGGFLTDAQHKVLADLAERYGFIFRPVDFYDDAMLAQCEVIFGYVKPEHLKAATSLRWLQVAFAGVESLTNPDLYAHSDVLLTNAAGAYGVSIAEHLIATLLMLLRGLPDYVLQQQRGEWNNKTNIRLIYGSSITVIGLGDIGIEFSRRAHALGATITGVRRTNRPIPDFISRVFTTDRLDDALPGADAVVLCLPSTKETQHIIDAHRFTLLKTHALLLNVGRGNAIDQDALCEALNKGKLGGAALDVCTPEPLPADHPLWHAKNCIITPHMAGLNALPDTSRRIVDIFAENLERYAMGKPLTHVVDIVAGY